MPQTLLGWHRLENDLHSTAFCTYLQVGMRPATTGHVALYGYSKTATLMRVKDPRTGDIMSVHFQNLRKLTTDEFITLLPTNFDADLLKTLGFYRYNKPGLPDNIGYTLPLSEIEDPVEEFTNAETPIPDQLQVQEDNFPPHLTRVLRSGKKIRVNTSTLPHPYVESAQYADWSKLPSMVKNENKIMKPAHPCRISSLNYTYTTYVKFHQQT